MNRTPSGLPVQAVFAIAAFSLLGFPTHAHAAGGATNFPPFVEATPFVYGWESCPVLIPVTAVDGDGDPITSLTADFSQLPAGNDAQFLVNATRTGGMFTWHPRPDDIGGWNVSFRATSNGEPGLPAVTRITVTPGTQARGTFHWNPALADTGTFTVTFSATNSNNETGSLPWPLTIVSAASGASMLKQALAALSPQKPTRGPIISIGSGCDGCGGSGGSGGSGGGGGSGGSGGICDINRYGGAQSDTVAVGCDDFSSFFEFVVRAVDVVASVVSLTADTSHLPPNSTAQFVSEIFPRPTALAGGPYSGTAGMPVLFNGSSSPPQSGTRLYTWDFGDATGAWANDLLPLEHTYAKPGTYNVTLTATDLESQQVGCDQTLVMIGGMLRARAFVADGRSSSTPLTLRGPALCIQIEPVGGDYDNVHVDLPTIRMYPGTPGSSDYISALSDKTMIDADRDRNGIQEITACFSREGLRSLFVGLEGRQTVPVTIEAEVKTGGTLRAQLDLSLVGVANSLAASVYPNPLNPTAKLALVTSRPGPLNVVLFDLNGRPVRTLLRRSRAESGYHEIEIDGRDQRGRRLASGVYFYLVEAAEGAVTGRVTLLK